MMDSPSQARPAEGIYGLVFAEEFSDPTATFPNASWTTDYKRWDGLRTLVNNEELQIYVDPAFKGTAEHPLGLNPFSVHDGILSIEARWTDRETRPHLWDMAYTSGLLTSTHSQTYGYFEISARLPAGRGLWPAFWLVGTGDHGDCEIDIFEVLGHEPRRIYHTVRSPDGPTDGSEYLGVDTSAGFHTYGLEWTPEALVIFVDGVETYRGPNRYNVPMYMLVNLAVGGTWPGTPDASTPFPARMEIDYIRAYQRIEEPQGASDRPLLRVVQ